MKEWTSTRLDARLKDGGVFFVDGMETAGRLGSLGKAEDEGDGARRITAAQAYWHDDIGGLCGLCGLCGHR
jgi:hypothetical protein